LNISWGEPADNSTASADAAERSIQWAGGWFANPIWGATGNYPQVMIDLVYFQFRIIGIIFGDIFLSPLCRSVGKALQLDYNNPASPHLLLKS